MKKSRIALILSVLCIIVLCVSLFSRCGRFYWISADQVKSIIFSVNHSPGYDLNEEDSEMFIKLFNSAKYKGTDIGYSTTPVCRIEVNYYDGSTLLIYEYGDHNYSVSFDSGDDQVKYFLSSEELDAFVWELIGKYR